MRAKPVLPPRLKHRHRHRIAEVEAALPWPHRQAHALTQREGLAQDRIESSAFAAKHQRVAGLPNDVGVRTAAVRGEGKTAFWRRLLGRDKRRSTRMAPHGGVLVIVEARALQQLVIHRKAQGLDQMQGTAGVGRQPNDVASIRRDFRLNQDDAEHAPHCRRPTPGPLRLPTLAGWACAPPPTTIPPAPRPPTTLGPQLAASRRW